MILQEYSQYDGLGLADLVRRGEASARDLVDSAIDAIERLNPSLNCVAQQLHDHALAELQRGIPRGPFHGVPFLIKEFGMHFKGMQSAYGSRLAVGMTFDSDTELMHRCRNAGLVTVGTTTTPELGFNATSEALVYGATRNPWNLAHSAGGSSGGSGAAVGSGLVPVAHANDGGGSIRIPAACNGLVGMKPTRGRTPCGPDAGIFAWGLAIEHAVTRSVRDSAALLDCLAGPDDGYFYCAPPPRRSFLTAAMTPPGTLRIGVLDQLPGTMRASNEYRARLADTVKLLEELGHACAPASLRYDAEAFNESSIRLFAATLCHFMNAFAAMTGRGIGAKTVEAVTLEVYRYGRKLKATDMEWAMGAQNQVSRAVGALMRQFDVLLTPALGREVAKLGELDQNARGVGVMDWWHQMMCQYSAFTPLFNTTGQPAISLPLWQSRAGLPIGMQFVGRLADEETLYSLAGQLEQALPWAGRRPPVYA